MKENLQRDELLAQSKQAYGQWCEQWRAQAKEHSNHPQIKNNLQDLEGSGFGRAALCVANGRSFQDNLSSIKENQENVDIVCCDKTLGHLLSNNITPQICIVMDANVDYEKYMEKWKDKLQDTILIANVCANPKWTFNGNWKKVYFTVQRDVMNNEIEFSEISGCSNLVPAGTNVSNGLVIHLTQSDNEGPKNFYAYDKILLIGFDYCWERDKYYSFDDDGGGKQYYMRHIDAIANNHKTVYTSTNLHFSSRWLFDYVSMTGAPAVQCSYPSLCILPQNGDLKEQIKYTNKKGRDVDFHSIVAKFRETERMFNKSKSKIMSLLNDQHESVQAF